MTISGSDWKALEPHIDRVLELDATACSEYLSALAIENPSIAAEVARFLADRAKVRVRGFLDSGAVAAYQDLLLAGTQFGSYTIQKRVGDGGMGSVWLARRNDGRFEGQVAVKLLNAALVGRPAEQRFAREGSILADLKHPNIAHLLDAGATAGGQAFLILEYIDGLRIDQYCETKGLAVDERVRLYLDVLAAVGYAHSHLIVHRDLKPSNIMVTREGNVKLLDFGIAALLTPGSGAAASGLTVEAGTAFTPEYAAPEQLLNQPVTTATDVYALGLVLFVLLAGRHPSSGSGDSAVERMRLTLDNEAPRLSNFTAGMPVERTLRGDLDNIVAKALKREPLERYASVESFADDLRRYLSNEPIKARPDSWRYRAGKFVTRHRVSVLTGTLMILALIGLSGFAWQQMNEARRQRDDALYQAKRAEVEASFNTLMMGSEAEGGRPLSPSEIIEQGIVLLDKQFGDDPNFVVHKLINMSGRFMDIGNGEKEYATLVKAERIARSTGDPALLAAVQCNTVETEIAAGRIAQAAARLKDGESALARVGNPDPADRANCTRAGATMAEAQGNTAGAIKLTLQAIAELERLGPKAFRDNGYSGLLSQLAMYYSADGRERDALSADQRNLDLLKQTGRGSTVGALGIMHNIASGLQGLGEIRAALALQGDVIRQSESADLKHELHPSDSATYGSLLARMGDLAGGLRWLNRAATDARATDNLVFELKIRANRARALIEAGRLDDAAADIKFVETTANADQTAYRNVLQRTAIVRAEYLLASGQVGQAHALIAPLALAIPRPLHLGGGEQSQRIAVVACRVALAGKLLDEALRDAEDAVELARLQARTPNASADVGEAYLWKARVLLAGEAGPSTQSAVRKAAQQAINPLTNGLGPRHALTIEAIALAR